MRDLSGGGLNDTPDTPQSSPSNRSRGGKSPAHHVHEERFRIAGIEEREDVSQRHRPCQCRNRPELSYPLGRKLLENRLHIAAAFHPPPAVFLTREIIIKAQP